MLYSALSLILTTTNHHLRLRDFAFFAPVVPSRPVFIDFRICTALVPKPVSNPGTASTSVPVEGVELLAIEAVVMDHIISCKYT